MTLEEKDLLQISATMIAGAFIFLSLSIAVLETTSDDRQTNLGLFNAYSTHAILAYVVIVPFSLSSLAALAAHSYGTNGPHEGWIRLTKVFMTLGFLAVLFTTLYVSVYGKL